MSQKAKAVCLCPEDRDSRGYRCGARAASEKPGGFEVDCGSDGKSTQAQKDDFAQYKRDEFKKAIKADPKLKERVTESILERPKPVPDPGDPVKFTKTGQPYIVEGGRARFVPKASVKDGKIDSAFDWGAHDAKKKKTTRKPKKTQAGLSSPKALEWFATGKPFSFS